MDRFIERYDQLFERKVGTLSQRYTLYKDPYFPRNKILVGYKGSMSHHHGQSPSPSNDGSSGGDGWIRTLQFTEINLSSECPDSPGDPYPLDAETKVMAKAHDDYFWPHRNGCPLCGSDAYVGFSRVECSNGRCGNFIEKGGLR